MSNAIIVDANSFGNNLRHDIRQAITAGKVKVVIPGEGKFRDELRNSNSDLFVRYSGSGRFHYVCVKQVHEICTRLTSSRCIACRGLKKCKCIKSNDAHVIALAIVSGANVLVTNDKKLSNDFKRCTKIHRNYGGDSKLKLPEDNKRKVINSHKGGTPKKSVSRIISETYPSHGDGNCTGKLDLCRSASLRGDK